MHGDSQNVDLKKITWGLLPSCLSFLGKVSKINVKSKTSCPVSRHPSVACHSHFVKAVHQSTVSNGLLQPRMHRRADSLWPMGQALGKMASAGSHGPRVKGGEGVLQEQTAHGVEHLADGRQHVTWAAGHGSA